MYSFIYSRSICRKAYSSYREHLENYKIYLKDSLHSLADARSRVINKVKSLPYGIYISVIW
jgi:hypothetical protein